MPQAAKRILVTGGQGFIGRNLLLRLSEAEDYIVSTFERGDDPADLAKLVAKADAVIHLAGENRPDDESAFEKVNTGLTRTLCDAIRLVHDDAGRHVPLVLASSTQAALDNPYGRSKKSAEEAVEALGTETGNPGVTLRLPGVFGKWCRPNYNSVVATFCHNITRGLDIQIDQASAPLRLVYIDDVVDALIAAISNAKPGTHMVTVTPEYTTTVGEIAAQIRAFENGREALGAEPVGEGLTRALYATYLSYLPQERFSYDIPKHGDDRGVFVEMLKTRDSGQLSYFTAHPNVTRGEHYHHTKSERFLVIKGRCLFRFRHLTTDEMFEVTTSGETPQIVESVPGWAHSVTNIGTTELIVMVWANEVFDRTRPDTIACKV